MPPRFCPPPSLDLTTPAYTLAHGPVWQLRASRLFDHPEIETTRYLLRRLDLTLAGMLPTVAVLRHSATVDHPRCFGPTFWHREGDALWIATVRPGGEPLSLEQEPLPWSDAVELWRPLALACAAAHSRGVVHGHLTPWSVWWEREAGVLTALEMGCWVGEKREQDSLWWPPELLQGARQPTPLSDVYGMARLLLCLTLGQPEASRAHPNMTGLPAFAIPSLERAIRPDPAERVVRMEELVAAMSPSLLDAFDARVGGDHKEELVQVLNATISARQALDHPRLGAGVKFFLHPPAGQDDVGAFFYEDVDRSLYDSIKWAWNGAHIHLLDARKIEDSRGRAFITGHRETLPVLEPTFPISVSNVLKAERCVSRFLVDERDSGESSRALVLGNLVHGLLEDLTAPLPLPFEVAYGKRIQSSKLEFLAAGLDDGQMEGIARDAKQHWINLARFTAPAGLLPKRPHLEHRGGDSAQSFEAQREHGWSGRHIEVSRYSPLYGLEGRIDLATEDEQEGVQIIELKSGSAWDGHLSQVRCYTLLWSGLAERRGVPMSGYVLYSRYGRLTAVPMDDVSRERRILRARNELVAYHRSHVDPSLSYTPPAFMDAPSDCKAPACKFRRDRCREQTQTLGLGANDGPERAIQGSWKGFDVDIVALAWSYWRHFERLIEMERWAQNSAFGAIFAPHSLQDRISEGHASAGMRICAINHERNLITFEGDTHGRFGPGTSILAHRGDLHSEHTLHGRVDEVLEGRLIVHSQAAPIASTLDHAGWIIESPPARLGVRQSKRALYSFLRQRDPAHIRALLDPHHPKVAKGFVAPDTLPEAAPPEADVPIRLRSSHGPALNDIQKKALHAALYAPTGALIQGPPGTGKTTVIAHIVRELVKRGERVLVCAQTNTAVDTILSKVLDAGVRTFLRIGSPERCPNLVNALEVEGADPALYFTDSFAERANSLHELSLGLSSCQVYGCTTYATGGHPVLEILSRQLGAPVFDVVIVDEASQLSEPMTLAALTQAKRFVLVGDHRQLPPIVQSEQALSVFFDPKMMQEEIAYTGSDLGEQFDDFDAGFPLPPELQKIGCAGLDRSLFERLVSTLPHTMLNEQYRMHEHIMAFSNRAFYAQSLHANDHVRGHTLSFAPGYLESLPPALCARLAPGSPVVFEHVLGTDLGRSNREEAKALVETLAALIHPEAYLSGGSWGALPTIGVISPFRAQVQLIRALIKEHLGDRAWQVDVDTVERYQGGERDIVLVSTVKTEHAGAHLSDLRRLNVTATRARKKLIFFGYRPCLLAHPTLRGLLEQEETTHTGAL